jgi:YrbI family 3-deoxy-D-manno-octulosonate 8-phosphate phosphatase
MLVEVKVRRANANKKVFRGFAPPGFSETQSKIRENKIRWEGLKQEREDVSKGGSDAKSRRGLDKRLKCIKAIFFDVDGVLTDGRIYLGEREEVKAYSTKDGFGILIAGAAGLEVFLVTGRSSASVTRRAGELGVKAFQNVEDKLLCVRTVCEKAGLKLDEVVFVGDDLNDLTVMREVGVSFAVANAAEDIKAIAHLTTSRDGGEGAAREVIERILRSQGKWNETVRQFLS